MKNKNELVIVVLFLSLALALQQSVSGKERPRAFPGAEGFGAYTPGGRGGKVLFVTNLDDYHPKTEAPVSGSLRAAVDTQGPRIVIFRVSGTIPLKDVLLIKEPYITIAGQSAPGDGICTKNHEVLIRTHDVIVRYLRCRPGDEVGLALAKEGKPFESDALTLNSFPNPRWTDFTTVIHRIDNVIIDHCSTSWSNDEVLSVSGPYISNITIQWCIISESLGQSTHGKGYHGKGTLLRCDGNVTFHHNLYAHHAARLPYAGTYSDGNVQETLLLDFRNNVIYGSGIGHTGKDPARINYVGNYVRKSLAKDSMFRIGSFMTWMYAEGNIMEGIAAENQWHLIAGEIDHNISHKPFSVAAVATHSASEAYERILNSCGAILPKRDAVDARIVEQVRQGTGKLINSQTEVGGWPELKSASAPKDSDRDGMPDRWERQYGLNPSGNGDAATDKDEDGYTNIEEWLNDTDPNKRDET